MLIKHMWYCVNNPASPPFRSHFVITGGVNAPGCHWPLQRKKKRRRKRSNLLVATANAAHQYVREDDRREQHYSHNVGRYCENTIIMNSFGLNDQSWYCNIPHVIIKVVKSHVTGKWVKFSKCVYKINNSNKWILWTFYKLFIQFF